MGHGGLALVEDHNVFEQRQARLCRTNLSNSLCCSFFHLVLEYELNSLGVLWLSLRGGSVFIAPCFSQALAEALHLFSCAELGLLWSQCLPVLCAAVAQVEVGSEVAPAGAGAIVGLLDPRGAGAEGEVEVGGGGEVGGVAGGADPVRRPHPVQAEPSREWLRHHGARGWSRVQSHKHPLLRRNATAEPGGGAESRPVARRVTRRVTRRVAMRVTRRVAPPWLWSSGRPHPSFVVQQLFA